NCHPNKCCESCCNCFGYRKCENLNLQWLACTIVFESRLNAGKMQRTFIHLPDINTGAGPNPAMPSVGSNGCPMIVTANNQSRIKILDCNGPFLISGNHSVGGAQGRTVGRLVHQPKCSERGTMKSKQR